jgi:hypothetical protein
MTGMKRSTQSVVALFCLVASVLGIYNVVSDNADVEHMAEGVACGTDPFCKAQKLSMERTPLAQTFEYTTTKRKVSIRCSRAYVLAGDYTCVLR